MGWGWYVANALPAAGVGNGATSAHIPENQVGGGGSRWVGGGCIAAQGRSCGWKTRRFSPPCNYNLIMHMEASIRSRIGPLPGYTAPGAGEPTQDRNNLISPGLTDEREQRRNSGLRNEQGVTADGAPATPINKGKSRRILMMSFSEKWAPS